MESNSIEYKIVKYPQSIVDDINLFEAKLNMLGKDGWSIVNQFTRIKKQALKEVSALNPMVVESEIVCILKRCNK